MQAVQKKLDALTAVLPALKVTGEDVKVRTLRMRDLATLNNTLAFDIVLSNPIRFVENVGGNVTSTPLMYGVGNSGDNTMEVKRERKGVSPTAVGSISISAFNDEDIVPGGWRYTFTFNKADVRANDRLVMTFKAPHAVPISSYITVTY